MPRGSGFEQAYNAQAAVDTAFHDCHCRACASRNTNDKKELKPALDSIKALPGCEPPPIPDDADAVTKLKHRLKTVAGKATYATRKSTVEPVLGIIKSVLEIRSFLLHGFDPVQGEWNLVLIGWSLKRLHALKKGVRKDESSRIMGKYRALRQDNVQTKIRYPL